MSKTFLITALIVGCLLGAGSIAYREIFPSGMWRYKITVNIESPEGTKSGSAIREVRLKRNLAKILNPDVSSVDIDTFGEAVVINLGENKFLFSIISNEFLDAFPEGSTLNNKIKLYNDLPINEPKPIRVDDYPWFVNFEKLDDPTSIRTINSSNISNIFGQGFSIKSVVIEKTDASITNGQLKIALPWLGHLPVGTGRAIPGNTDQAKYLNYENFIKSEQ